MTLSVNAKNIKNILKELISWGRHDLVKYSLLSQYETPKDPKQLEELEWENSKQL